MYRITLFVVVLLSLPVIAYAQNSEKDSADSTAEVSGDAYKSIDSITNAVYSAISGPAGERRDWTFFKTLFAPGARLIPLRTRDGVNSINALTIDEYIAMVDNYFLENGFFEIETSRTTEQYGSIAHHFSTYESRRDPTDAEPFQRGINSFQLMNDGTRWWVVTIFWQGETAAVPIPEKYLR